MKITLVDPMRMSGVFDNGQPTYRAVIMSPPPLPGYAHCQDEYELTQAQSVLEAIEWCEAASPWYKLMLDMGEEGEGTLRGRYADLVVKPYPDERPRPHRPLIYVYSLDRAELTAPPLTTRLGRGAKG
ncbi:hypothetical protein [Falsarthrobacter nasiphocae]|uniref:Uncharacterized protein n=1 Tax=Falsarthrobacter nasiphocae TaxID=189863 RepID=A0AAE4C752_9MICC|nr:hypothetical protein [Falsarthrobacter nasiphocae]MDR6892882.1 hypothetical protein [Falsarthrobacter nasiphocae]